MTPNPLPFAVATAIIIFAITAALIYFRRDEHKRDMEKIDASIRFIQQGIKEISFGIGSVVVFYRMDESDAPIYKQFDPPPAQLRMQLSQPDTFLHRTKSSEKEVDKDSPQALAQVLIAASLQAHQWGAKSILTIREATKDKEIMSADQWRTATNWLQANHGIIKDNISTRCGNALNKSCLGELAQVIGIEISAANTVLSHPTTTTHTTQHQRK